MLGYMYYDHMGWGWGVLMTLGWIILLGLFIALVMGALRDRTNAKRSAGELLDQRLASGDITVEEYELLRAAMNPSPPRPSRSDPGPPAGSGETRMSLQ